MVPIAAGAGVLAARYVPTSRDPRARRTDRAGFALSTATIGLLVYTTIEAPNHGWGSERTLGSLALTAVLAVVFVAWERRARAPMLPLRLFKRRNFTWANAETFTVYAALSTLTFFLVIFLFRFVLIFAFVA